MDYAINCRDPHMSVDRLRMLARDLFNWCWRRSVTIDNIELAELIGPPGYGQLEPATDARFAPISLPHFWQTPDRYAWVRFSVNNPGWPANDGPLFLRGKLSDSAWNARNPQAIVMVNGVPAGGIDTAHHVVRLPEPGAERFDFLVLVWTGMDIEPGPAQPFALAQLDAAGEQFALDLSAAVETADALDLEDYRRYPLLDACMKAASLVDLSRPVGEGFHASLPAAHAALREAMSKIDLPADRPVAAAVGHGHLDLGWLWPVEASHFKALNTVINQLNLIDEIGEHVFLWSQPQCWKWIQHDHPPTWQRIVEKVRSGNWEASAGMWVEADTNITSGESLIRQMLYGTRFLREHLGQEETLLWLPDVFGYSAALPQLLQQFGIEYFMTTKISWNEFNVFPWETFNWQGLDGSTVLTHFGACRHHNSYITYNVTLGPKAVHEGWREYRAKSFSDRFLVSFGHGDGGGGPARHEIQIGRRLGRMPGLPNVRFQRPREFFAELAEQAKVRPLPTWVGELYLEFHRGTYTTEARTKRGNRLCENRLHDAELLAAMAMSLGGQWDKHTLDNCWERLLLNQFHDILPGSSIEAVYTAAERDYRWILGLAGEVRDRAASRIAASIDTAGMNRPIVLFNTTDTIRRDPIELPPLSIEAEGMGVRGQTGKQQTPYPNLLPQGEGVARALRFPDGSIQPIQQASDPDGRAYTLAGNSGIGPIGWTVAELVDRNDARTCGPAAKRSVVVTDRLLENAFWRIELDGGGRIARWLDKQHNRDVLAEGQLGNQLQLLRDRPTANFAWNVDYHDLSQPPLTVLAADRVEVVENGPVRAAMRCSFAFGRSRLVQDLRIHRDIARVDFSTWCDWHEQDLLLKAAFTVDVFAPEATFEIQFGSIRRPTHRNTSWDLARFEVPAQRWIDLSETGYGVSMLNDCKYGHEVLGGLMRLSLLRGPLRSREATYADQGEHRFTYSLLPHGGGWARATIDEATQLNMPILACQPPAPARHSEAPMLPRQLCFASSDNPAFIITAIKKAEDDDRLVIRGYESVGGRGEVTLRFGPAVRSAWRSRADERVDSQLELKDNSIKLTVRPFEVVTVKVQIAESTAPGKPGR